MSDSRFDEAERMAAEAVDVAIEDSLHGGPSSDATVAALVAAFAVGPPPELAAEIRKRAAAEQSRRSPSWMPARLAAAALAYFYAASGITNIFFGHWLARIVKNAYAPHVYREGGLAFLAVSALLAWAAFRPRWLDAAVLVGSPLGVLVAINGAGEIVNLRPGALDHVPELVGALALAFFWWRARRRYQTNGSTEEQA